MPKLASRSGVKNVGQPITGINQIVLTNESTNLFVPVYQVTQFATSTNATNLAALLNIPTNTLGMGNGMIYYIDPTNYLLVPTLNMTDTSDPATSNLIANTKGTNISVQAIDFATLTNLSVMDTNAAMDLTSNMLSEAGLTPQFGTAAGGHDVFTAVFTNTGAQVTAAHQYLDTLVNYQFSLSDGLTNHPLIGAGGAQAQLAFGPGGNVTRLYYSVPQMTAGPMVQLISPTEASNRAVSLYPISGPV